MAIDDNTLKAIIATLKGVGVTLTDIEKEVNLRNKWGKKSHPAMLDYTTEEITSAAEKWMRL